MVVLGLAAVAQELATDHALDEPLRGHQRNLLGRHTLLHRRRAGAVCHHHVKFTCRDVWGGRGDVRCEASVLIQQHNGSFCSSA